MPKFNAGKIKNGAKIKSMKWSLAMKVRADNLFY